MCIRDRTCPVPLWHGREKCRGRRRRGHRRWSVLLRSVESIGRQSEHWTLAEQFQPAVRSAQPRHSNSRWSQYPATDTTVNRHARRSVFVPPGSGLGRRRRWFFHRVYMNVRASSEKKRKIRRQHAINTAATKVQQNCNLQFSFLSEPS